MLLKQICEIRLDSGRSKAATIEVRFTDDFAITENIATVSRLSPNKRTECTRCAHTRTSNSKKLLKNLTLIVWLDSK